MPTINQLPTAAAAADDDLLPVSQGGKLLSATRAQLVAGLQPNLAVLSGALMGRVSPGLGAPESIGIGANLRLAGGMLLGPAPFATAALPAAAAPSSADLLPLSHGGQDAAVSYGALMAGLSGLRGIDLSAHQVQAPGTLARTLADWLSEAVTPEAFGAVGDGVADDSPALDRAIATGRPVRLAPRTYAVRGGWTVTRDAVLLGAHASTLRRIPVPGTPATGAFINLVGPSFTAVGVTFDGAGVPGDSWGVLVGPACTRTVFDGCGFTGAVGSSLGSGLVIQARDGIEGATPTSRHQVLRCEAWSNQVHGIWVQAAAGALIEGCLAHGNGAYGIALDFNDPAFAQIARHGRVLGNLAWGNSRGISVGNYNETNLEPPRWGNGNPDAVDVLVAGNVCYGNSAYGIAVSGRGMQVVGNQLAGNGSGVLANCSASRVVGNLISAAGAAGPSYFGIDSGGSIDGDVSDNFIGGCAVGINPGGSSNLRVAGNQLLGNGWGITVYNVETDGHGGNFGIACTGLLIEGNRIVLGGGSGGGVLLLDAPAGVQVARNAFFPGPGGTTPQALNAHTDALLMGGNTWNNQASLIVNPSLVGALQQLQVPDMLDGVMITAAPSGIDGMEGQHQAVMAGRVAFIKVTAGGYNFTQAAVAISGDGHGALATAYVRDGAIVGITVTNGGSGYTAAAAVVTGDGLGALAVASVGLPVPQGRRLRLHCNCAVRFRRVGSAPFQDNWTLGDFTAPAATAVDWEGTWGGWQALGLTPGDFLTSPGDGTLQVRTTGGDMTLHPAGSGRVRVGSDAEPAGFATALGRGSPEGVVTAPPGSDYRNLDGGAGTTLWLKRSGAGPAGWAAIG